MKKLILTLVAVGAAASVMAQGYINYNMRVTGVIVGHVYGTAVGETDQKTGNTASEVPAGAQTYLGAFLTGSGYSAQLWYAVGAGQSEGVLGVLASSTTTFRTGATLGGTIAAPGGQTALQIPGVAPGVGVGTFQFRAWDNAGGTITDWNLATIRGKSALFELTGLGDGVLTLPKDMDTFRSFNIYAVPEPSTFVLAGLGAAGLLIFRRRK